MLGVVAVMRRFARGLFCVSLVSVAALWAMPSAQAQEWIAPVVGASVVGGATLAIAIGNHISLYKQRVPSTFMRISGYAMGALSIAGGAMLASFAPRMVDHGPTGEPGTTTPIYVASGCLVAIGVYSLGTVALAELRAVRRIKLVGLLDRDVAGRLYGGAAVSVLNW